ncbi:hypothetical protein C8Q80DRAFT_1123016 [Daedaleopsis nitida]|nr:hypothetical protein C8Q80DRAFT_1123016 [Daedaleopsis nitida]
MSWIYVFRVCSLVVASICAIIVLALSAQTTAASRNLARVSFNYSNMGIAASVMTLAPMPWMLIIDCCSSNGAIIIFELLYLSLLWILYIAAAALTFVEADFSAIVFNSCDELIDPGLISICRDAQPIGVISILTAVILMIYTSTLLIVTAGKSRRDSAVWRVSVKESEKV